MLLWGLYRGYNYGGDNRRKYIPIARSLGNVLPKSKCSNTETLNLGSWPSAAFEVGEGGSHSAIGMKPVWFLRTAWAQTEGKERKGWEQCWQGTDVVKCLRPV